MPASHVHLRLEPTRVVRVRQTAFSRRRSGQLLAARADGGIQATICIIVRNTVICYSKLKRACVCLVYAEVLTNLLRCSERNKRVPRDQWLPSFELAPIFLEMDQRGPHLLVTIGIKMRFSRTI